MSTEGTQKPYDLEEIAETFDTEQITVEAYEKEGSVEVEVGYDDTPEYEKAVDTVSTQLPAYLQSTSTRPQIEGNVLGDLGDHRFRVRNEDLKTVQEGVENFLRDLEGTEVEN